MSIRRSICSFQQIIEYRMIHESGLEVRFLTIIEVETLPVGQTTKRDFKLRN